MKQKIGESLHEFVVRRRKAVQEETRAFLDAVGFGIAVFRDGEHVPIEDFYTEPPTIEILAVIAHNTNQARVDLERLGATFESKTTGRVTHCGQHYHFFVAFDERHLRGKRFTAVLKLHNADWRACRLADEMAYRFASTCQNGRDDG